MVEKEQEGPGFKRRRGTFLDGFVFWSFSVPQIHPAHSEDLWLRQPISDPRGPFLILTDRDSDPDRRRHCRVPNRSLTARTAFSWRLGLRIVKRTMSM